MDRVVEPLRAMGAAIDGREGGRFTPLTITGGSLHGIDYTPPVASAQVKSAMLLAGLFAEGTTTVRESVITRRHTEEMLVEHGVDVTTLANEDGGSVVTLDPRAGVARRVRQCQVTRLRRRSGSAQQPRSLAQTSRSRTSTSHPSAPAFSDVLLSDGCRPRRSTRLLARFACVGAELTGTVVEASELPDLIDEVPALSIAGALARSGVVAFRRCR